ncbi:MAG: class I SAM-dependent methyltransferase [Acidobacteriia bacterium]|nr:class I SAM-dependent methyltransferase [Terriglobia bacterium]
MAKHVCPWWLGYLVASPVRRLMYDPAKILPPYVREGMTVLEPGPGMGFFTLELARLVGPSGRVVAVDIQPRMIEGLKRRAARAGLLERVDARLVASGSMGVKDLAGTADLALAFAVVHELPAAASFFIEITEALKPGGHLLFAEPTGHVNAAQFESQLQAAAWAGLQLADRPSIRFNRTAVLKKP